MNCRIMILEGDVPLGVRVIAKVDTVVWIEDRSTFWDLCVGVIQSWLDRLA